MRENNFSPKFHSCPNRARKFQIKNSKKIHRIRKHHFGIISIQIGMRQAEKEKKKNLVPNSVPTQPGQENSKKNSKTILKIKNHQSGIGSIKTWMR